VSVKLNRPNQVHDSLNICLGCNGPLIEIDHYGERLVGCIECNRWSWQGSKRLFMELPDEDLRGAENDGAQVGLIKRQVLGIVTVTAWCGRTS